MSTCEMISVIDEARDEEAQAIRERSGFLVGDLRTLLSLPPIPPPPPLPAGERAPSYCRWIESVQGLLLPKTAQAQSPAQGPRPQNAMPRGSPPFRCRSPYRAADCPSGCNSRRPWERMRAC